MLDLEAQFDVRDVNLALLFSYCASLAHIEEELLQALVGGEGTSNVVIVLDEIQHEETFSEAAALLRTGLDYRVHPAQLPVRGPAFHPKLYLLASRLGLRAIVASANLTLYGCRANVEVGATLDLGANGEGDARAFADLADFLEHLPDTVRLGGGEEAVGECARRIRQALPDPLPTSGPRVLHSLERSILAQLTARVPASDVHALQVISPYFDRDGKTLARLQAAYPGAEMTVFTGPDAAGTLDGDRVAGFTAPPGLKIVHGADGIERSLHAKVVRLETADGVWTLVGSPNASEPGMLRSVPEGGNVEVALLSPEDLASGLESLDTKLGDWNALSYTGREVPGAAAPERPRRVSVASASLDGSGLSVRARGDWDEGTEWSLSLMLPTGEVQFPVSVHPSSEEVELSATATGIEIGEDPVVVRVTARTSEGVREGRAWLNQVNLLRRTGWERRTHRLAARIEGSRSLSDAESKAFVDIVLKLVGEICAPPDDPIPATSGDEPDDDAQELESQREQTIAVDALIGTPDSTTQERRASSLRRKDALERILRAFRNSFLHLTDDEETDDVVDLEGGGTTRRKRSSLKVTTIRHLESTFRDTVLAWKDAPIFPERVPEMIRLIETVIWALLRYQLRLLRDDSPHAKLLNDVLIEALRYGFSLDGMNSGETAGWVVQAWADPGSRPEVREFLSTDGVREGYLAHLGAAIARGRAVGTTRGNETWRLIRAGLDIASGTGEVDAEALDRIAATLVTGDEQLQKEDILAALDGTAGEPKLLRTARWWASLAMDGASAEIPGDAPSVIQKVGEQVAQGVARLAPLRTEGEAHCGGCRVSVPSSDVQHLADPEHVTTCQTCGAILIPLDVTDHVCHEVLAELQEVGL